MNLIEIEKFNIFFTLRNLTCTPEPEYMGIWKSTLMGGRTQGFSRVATMRSTTASNVASLLPAKLLIRHLRIIEVVILKLQF